MRVISTVVINVLSITISVTLINMIVSVALVYTQTRLSAPEPLSLQLSLGELDVGKR